jgi:transposase-like protein
VEARVFTGTKTEAQWHALTQANRTHGKRRTTADKVRAVRLALAHPNAAGRSDRDLAAALGVHHETVAKYRSQLESTGEIASSPTRTGKDGKTRRVPEKPAEPEPDPEPPMPPNPFEDEPEQEPEPDASEAPTPRAPEKVTDGRGRPVPLRFHEVFKRAAEYDITMRLIAEAKTAAVALAKDPVIGHHLHPQELAADLDNALSALKFAKPYAVCSYCGGKGCSPCRQSGYLGRDVFKQAPQGEEDAA